MHKLVPTPLSFWLKQSSACRMEQSLSLMCLKTKLTKHKPTNVRKFTLER